MTKISHKTGQFMINDEVWEGAFIMEGAYNGVFNNEPSLHFTQISILISQFDH